MEVVKRIEEDHARECIRELEAFQSLPLQWLTARTEVKNIPCYVKVNYPPRIERYIMKLILPPLHHNQLFQSQDSLSVTSIKS